MKYKTTELKLIYDFLLKNYPQLKKYSDEIQSILCNIQLPDKNMIGEYFVQYVSFLSTTLPITWDVDCILNTSFPDSCIEYISVNDLKELIDFNNPINLDTLRETRCDIQYPHKGKYIIIGSLAGFPGDIIIDGNHRVLENRNKPNKIMPCIKLNNENVLKFLAPNSRKLIELFLNLNHLV